MANVFLIVEGATEEQFYGKVLQDYFVSTDGTYRHYFQVVQMPHIKNDHRRMHKGGAISFERSVVQVRRFLHSATHAQRVFLVYDYYGLHPSFTEHILGADLAFEQKIQSIVERFESEINDIRFSFRLQVHEFESLLFAAPDVIADHFNQPNHQATLEAMVAEAGGNPERINNNRATAPSKRLKATFSGYGKVVDGITLARKIGVDQMRQRCAYFDQFCGAIEGLSGS